MCEQLDGPVSVHSDIIRSFVGRWTFGNNIAIYNLEQ